MPLQHFRRTLMHLASTPEAIELVLEGTGIQAETIGSPDFELNDQALWRACANVRRMLGEGWYFRVPVLWSLDVHSHLEGAMRLAPTLGQALDTLERVGTVRWPVARWQIVTENNQVHLTCHRLTAVPQPEWQMMGLIFAMNVRTILEAAHPHVVPHIRYGLEGSCPVPAAEAEQVVGSAIAWNAEHHALTFPAEFMWSRSVLGEPRAYAALVGALEKLYQVETPSWTGQVKNLLDDRRGARLGCDEVARTLGISRRTLERHLSNEGSCFSELLDSAMKDRCAMLMRDGQLSVAAISERMGYSDESALSRATRRWHGCTAAELRRRLREQGTPH
ncbi:MAG: helix-turn-helix domain-containing protein [Novosphingobium sp.]